MTRTIEQPSHQDSREYTARTGESSSNFSTALGLRQSYFTQYGTEGSKISIGTIRPGDKFSLVIDGEGNGVLSKKREKTEPGERAIKVDIKIPPEAIYQKVEKGPDGFSFVKFVKISQDMYKMESSRKTDTGVKNELEIPIKNLDAFRAELGKIKPEDITRFLAKSAQKDLLRNISQYLPSMILPDGTKEDILFTHANLLYLARLSRTNPDVVKNAIIKSIPISMR